MSTNPLQPPPHVLPDALPHVLEYRTLPPAKAPRPSARDLLVGTACSLACVALCIWVAIAFVGGIVWFSGGHWFIGIILHLSAIAATPPACLAAEAAGALFSGKTARARG